MMALAPTWVHRALREHIDILVNYALSVEAQTGFVRNFWYSPTNRKVEVTRDLSESLLFNFGHVFQTVTDYHRMGPEL